MAKNTVKSKSKSKNKSKNGIYDIKRNNDETDQNYHMRVAFIAKVRPMTDTDFHETERLSDIWINMEVLGCRYIPQVEEKIAKILELGLGKNSSKNSSKNNSKNSGKNSSKNKK